jgi:hypothetical protein
VTPAAPGAAFYCVADDRYFLGAVGMVNSLRLLGHDEPIYLLDCGLTDEQGERLATQTTVVPGPGDEPPWLLKTIAPLRNPAEVAILIDADIVVTRPLSSLVERASSVGVVAFENYRDRFCPKWGELLDLGPPRRRPYVSSGLVFLGGPERGTVLELLDDRQQRVDIELGFYGRKLEGYPFIYPEQDVLNAILMTRIATDRVASLDNRLAPNPPFHGLRVREDGALRCAYRDGTEPFALHHFVRKPWLEPTYHSIYSRLLVRALRGPGVAIPVADEELPLRLREGEAARRARRRSDARDFLRWHFGDKLPRPIGARMEALRRRRAGRAW